MSIARLLHRDNPWLAADRLERLKVAALYGLFAVPTAIGLVLLVLGLGSH